MKAGETTLRDVLQGERQYIVPIYQRRYSWSHEDEKDLLSQLWDDITALVGTTDSATHFLGSVVLAPSPDNVVSGVQRWLVVDGQQRLTTLSILLCAIRDYVRDADPQLANKIDDLYLINRYADGASRYTLLPTPENRAAWIALVERAPDAGGQDRIGEAYRFYRRKLLEYDDPDDETDLRQLEAVIAARLALVEIRTHQDDNVFRIFESLNYKGKPLTQADLLRNYLFMRLPSRGDHLYQARWLPLQKLLTDDELEDLVWLDLILRGDDRATQESVYRLQQKRLDLLESEEEIEQWAAELHTKAAVFDRILRPESEKSPQLRRALQRLNEWGAQTVRPIALRVLIAHDNFELTDTEASEALRMVEGYLVRRTILGIASANVNRILMTLVKELGDKTPTAEAIRALLSRKRKFPPDELIRDAVMSGNFYWYGRGPQRSFILRCLEEDFNHGEPVDFGNTKLTIEHILPQKPLPDTLQSLSHETAEGQSPEDLHAELVHTLGNLTLTAYNNKLGNHEFTRKRQILQDSGLAMNRNIAESQAWGAKEIRQRSRMLADRVLRIWPGPLEGADQPELPPKWLKLNQVLASIPAGRWAGYSDVAEVIGTTPVAIGTRLGAVALPNAHRVLNIRGELMSGFRWPDPTRQDDPWDVLEAEGIRRGPDGRAAIDQRMTAEDLASEMYFEMDPADE